MALVVREGNGCWHVYDSSTEPWALVTAFAAREAALIYVEKGRIRSDHFEVQIEHWHITTLQETCSCTLCSHRLTGGEQVYTRSLRILSGEKVEMRYEFKCLGHLRTRFDRDDPL